eukprot:1144380-Pelagomonas_calceolata.AAC.10
MDSSTLQAADQIHQVIARYVQHVLHDLLLKRLHSSLLSQARSKKFFLQSSSHQSFHIKAASVSKLHAVRKAHASQKAACIKQTALELQGPCPLHTFRRGYPRSGASTEVASAEVPLRPKYWSCPTPHLGEYKRKKRKESLSQPALRQGSQTSKLARVSPKGSRT